VSARTLRQNNVGVTRIVHQNTQTTAHHWEGRTMHEMLKTTVELANDFNFELEAALAHVRMTMVRKRIADNDVVFAVWQDAGEPDGVGYRLVKGQQLLRESMASGTSVPVSITGIRCIDAGQARALAQAEGEKDRRH
jgi:hypothetical protein